MLVLAWRMGRARLQVTGLSAVAMAPACEAGTPAGASSAFLAPQGLLVQPSVAATPVVAFAPAQEVVLVVARVSARHRRLDLTRVSCLDAPASGRVSAQ